MNMLQKCYVIKWQLELYIREKNGQKEYELSYWLKEKDKVLVNPKIKDLVTDCMTQVAEKRD